MAAARSEAALDRAEIRADLEVLGLSAGSVCLVHSSLRNVGPLVDGPATVAAALIDVLGPHGTLVVPAFTARNSTTTREFLRRTAGMSAEQRHAEEANIVPFDPDITPAQDVGVFAEYVRAQPDSVRSAHPQTSFAAIGPAAAEIARNHALDCHLGERSPLGALYDCDAVVLLLGVAFDVCTCFHLAEHRLPWPAPRRPYQTYVLQRGLRTKCEFVAADADDEDFGRIGAALETQLRVVCSGRVGDAVASRVPLRKAVDFAAGWMSRWRTGDGADRERGAV